MRGLFRRHDPGLSDYVALAVAAAAYLAVMAVVLAPDRFLDRFAGPEASSAAID